ncbi:M48 family metallopeptidase [Noviherbaspirillum sp.]|uniref:M48 family metallopeptidase n=1 Tax=Noviherbaspirillum sp. TaxID=1926288 RepID=UPI002FDFC259
MKVLIRYGDDTAQCDVQESASIASKIRIHVYPNGRIEIEAPLGKSVNEIQNAAQKRARWVFSHLKVASSARALSLAREYVSGEGHFYLGRRYKLTVSPAPMAQSSVKLTRGRLEVAVYSCDPAVVRRRLKNWYHERAQDYLSRRLSHWVATLPFLKVEPPLKLISMSTQWGSCSPQGTIHLNPALVKAPRQCIDYVIVHEVCHLVEHNHSRRFYHLLDRYMPDWRSAKAELDGLAEMLLME